MSWASSWLEKISVALDANRDEAYFQEFYIEKGMLKYSLDAELIGVDKIIVSEVGNIKECKVQALPDARDVADLAHTLLKNKIVDYARTEPIYLRKSDAEIKLAANNV